jgi:16S rRNA (guanine527-N7)-methyltransferase
VPDTDQGGAPGAAPSPAVLHEVLLGAREAGFLGPGPVETHLAHAEGFAVLAREQTPETVAGPRILDLGSGGGLPGLMVAARWPEASLVLLDAMERRTDFLRRAVARTGLGDRVSVVTGRAELYGRDPDYRGTFDGVVVRSFGAPAVVAECAAPFLRSGGWLIVSEPPGSPTEVVEPADGLGAEARNALRWPAEPLAQFGLEPVIFVRRDFGYQVLRQSEACPDRFPRRNGVPAKNPLF